MSQFKDRAHAGQVLAEHLLDYRDKTNALILALPRGGVPVAFEIAKNLHLPLDIYLVRKLGVPGQEELAMGAIADGDVTVFNFDILNSLSIDPEKISAVIAAERCELARRNKLYRDGRPIPIIENKTIILVDDGLATGATMRAAITALRKAKPEKIIVAVPVGSADICEQLEKLADEVICAAMPRPFYGVGAWYDDFAQTNDVEVIRLLKQASSLVLTRNSK